MQNVNDIYQTTILPLSEADRLKLAEMIVNDAKPIGNTNGGSNGTGIRALFGTGHSTQIDLSKRPQLDHNEQIDFDLGLAYSDNHEDKE